LDHKRGGGLISGCLACLFQMKATVASPAFQSQRETIRKYRLLAVSLRQFDPMEHHLENIVA